MSHSASILALKIGCESFIVIGIAMVLSVFTPLGAVLEFFLDLAVWPVDGAQTMNAVETRLGIAISGGLLAGWATMILLVVTHVYAKDKALGGRIITVSALVWFALDSFGSVMAGAAMNAVFNLGFLLVLLVPLALAREPSVATA